MVRRRATKAELNEAASLGIFARAEWPLEAPRAPQPTGDHRSRVQNWFGRMESSLFTTLVPLWETFDDIVNAIMTSQSSNSAVRHRTEALVILRLSGVRRM